MAPLHLGAQEGPAKRVANIVSVAIAEYGLAVDARGKLISDLEYEEAVTFLKDAREVAERMSGDRVPPIRALLDSMSTAVNEKRPPAEVGAIHASFVAALGADAALDMPTRRLDLADGRSIYQANCASCHGVTGMADGPAAAQLNPPPPPLGDAAAMADVSPALMYRKIAVGVAGTSMVGWASTLSPDQRWNVVAYLNAMRAPASIAPGEGLFLQRCAGCHGPTGASDGQLTQALSKLPVELSSFGWQAERSDKALADAIRAGIAGSAMPPSRDLSDADVAQLVAHLRTLSLADVPVLGLASTDPTDGAAVGRRVIALLDEALNAARTGRNADAGDKAFDSYIAFEPLETPARARNPGLVASMERMFADFKGSVKTGDIRSAEKSRDALESGMPGIIELTKPASGFWGNFLQSFLIILREGFEAILVVGAVVAFLIKTGHRERLRSIWVGVIAALVASGITAVILATVLRALPATREIIEGVTMLIAVAVLFSVSYWLISKVEAARWQQFIKEKVNNALQHGGGRALTVVAFLAVYREGAETALFYQALIHEGALTPIALGLVAGFVVLAVIFTAFYRHGVRIPLRPFFAVTSGLLYYMAFVFMGKGIRELQEGNVVPITVLPGFPHIEAMGLYPSVETLLAQSLLLVLFVFALAKTFWPRRSVTLPTVSGDALPNGASGEMAGRIEALERKVREMEQSIVLEHK
ncbi:MAG: FTR1 family protein [Cytophagaceae bacterium]|nr:FTR1 family protein [Gemmatimonadaceae bacterium]